MRDARLPSARTIAASVRTQAVAQFDRLTLWFPVAFGVGSAAYLGLKSEPPLWPAVLAAVCLGTAALWVRARSRQGWLVALVTLLALCAAGFAAAKHHSDTVAAPIAPDGLGVVRVEGWVVDIASPSERGARLVIAPVRIGRLAPAATPLRIRLVVAAPGGPESVPVPGTGISVLALLDPPPGPASPGAYDFARDAWFEGIGGVGLAMRAPEAIALAKPPLALRVEMGVNALRWRVAEQLVADIRSAMGVRDGGAAGLAAAVTTSHQDWLAQDHRDDLRASGLAHMLAIAGLHTAAVSGFVFFAVRFLVAAWPWLALRVPGKKLAAAAGLMAVAGYLVLSGAHPPARRAAITASVAFVAILLDRRAVSLHSLAIAAFVILLIEPDVVVQPGFEMSFCATASLVAMAELWRRAAPAPGLPWPLAAVQAIRDWTIAMLMVSFVAGSATGPFAIQHFNRVANYGVLANLTADFLASVVLMPTLAFSLLVEALGLAHSAAPVFWVAGWAARTIVVIGHTFATAPGAGIAWPSAPTVALILSYVGIVCACLWRGSLRWAFAPLAAAVALWPRPPAPVAWIAADGDDAAIVVGSREVAMKPGARLYATQLWAQRRGFTFPADPVAAQKQRFDCDRRGCVPIGAYRPAIAAWWGRKAPSTERFETLCASADIVILRAPEAPPGNCGGALVLTGRDFARNGAVEIFRTPRGLRLSWSQPIRGDRPWSRPPPG